MNLENNRDTLNLQKRVAEDTTQELKKRDKTIFMEITSLDKERISLSSKMEKGEKQLNVISAEIVKDRSVIELKNETVRGTYQSMDEIQSKIRSEQKTRESLIEEMKANELRIVAVSYTHLTLPTKA